MKTTGPILFGVLILGASLYLSSRKAAAAERTTPANPEPIRNPTPRQSAINTNPDLWTRLGMPGIRDALSSGDTLKIPNFGRARITDQTDARLYSAVLPQSMTFDEKPEQVWARAAPAITGPVLDVMSFWTSPARTERQLITPELIAAREPRPAMVPLPGDVWAPNAQRNRFNAATNPLAPPTDSRAQVL